MMEFHQTVDLLISTRCTVIIEGSDTVRVIALCNSYMDLVGA